MEGPTFLNSIHSSNPRSIRRTNRRTDIVLQDGWRVKCEERQKGKERTYKREERQRMKVKKMQEGGKPDGKGKNARGKNGKG